MIPPCGLTELGPNFDLTGRQMAVLRLAAEGFSNKQIAAYLQLSVQTIKNHKSRAFQKLQVSTVAQAAMKLFWCEAVDCPLRRAVKPTATKFLTGNERPGAVET